MIISWIKDKLGITSLRILVAEQRLLINKLTGDLEDLMSKKNERVQKLIALHTMLSQQKRDMNGNVKFNNDQMVAALKVITEILKLDNIVSSGD